MVLELGKKRVQGRFGTIALLGERCESPTTQHSLLHRVRVRWVLRGAAPVVVLTDPLTSARGLNSTPGMIRQLTVARASCGRARPP